MLIPLAILYTMSGKKVTTLHKLAPEIRIQILERVSPTGAALPVGAVNQCHVQQMIFAFNCSRGTNSLGLDVKICLMNNTVEIRTVARYGHPAGLP